MVRILFLSSLKITNRLLIITWLKWCYNLKITFRLSIITILKMCYLMCYNVLQKMLEVTEDGKRDVSGRGKSSGNE